MEEVDDTHLGVAKELYIQARLQGIREDWLNRLRGKPADLLPYEAIAGLLRSYQHLQLTELRSIPLDKIIGSVGRYRDFTRSFRPRGNIGADRWALVDKMMAGALGMPAIEVYQIGAVYFVADGNHRVSVARANGFKEIDAYVTLIPAAADLEAGDSLDEAIIKAECSAFLAQTRLTDHCQELDISFTRPGGYPTLLEHIYSHRYFMELDRVERSAAGGAGDAGGGRVTFMEAAADWYDRVYLPIIASIRQYALLKRFPGYTAADLYVLVSSRILELSEAGESPTPDAVAQEIARTAPTPLAAAMLDLVRRLFRVPRTDRRMRGRNKS